jgi:50S ribosomal subunit-associated GTPase HflX
LNKTDIADPEKIREAVTRFTHMGFQVSCISGLTGTGIQQLKELLEDKLEEARQPDDVQKQENIL